MARDRIDVGHVTLDVLLQLGFLSLVALVLKQKGKAEKVSEKNKTNTPIKLLPSVTQNLGPVAVNGDGGEKMGKERKEEEQKTKESSYTYLWSAIFSCCYFVICQIY